MLGKDGFDLWAEGYDKSVGLSEERDEYPFAGYRRVLGSIYRRAMEMGGPRVLDIGFGTGVLTRRLYEAGCDVWGQDFSEKMLEKARAGMPGAHLYLGDFGKGLAPEIERERFGLIAATYSLHHLDMEGKCRLIGRLMDLLETGGAVMIGDVAFETREEMDMCRERAGEEWDEEEMYFVYEEMRERFPGMTFERMSHCAGVMTLEKK